MKEQQSSLVNQAMQEQTSSAHAIQKSALIHNTHVQQPCIYVYIHNY